MKMKILPLEELIRLLEEKGVEYDYLKCKAPYFPLEDVEACMDNEISALPNHRPCPLCGKPSEQLKCIHFCSPKWTWDKLMGRSGAISICPDCRCLVEFKCYLMN